MRIDEHQRLYKCSGGEITIVIPTGNRTTIPRLSSLQPHSCLSYFLICKCRNESFHMQNSCTMCKYHDYSCCCRKCRSVLQCLTVGKNVKCTVVQALRLCTGRTARRGSRGIALLFLDHRNRRGQGSASRLGRSLPPGKTRYPLYRRLGGVNGRSGQVGNVSPPLHPGIRSPHRPASSQSLYRLSYPARV